jgi:nucleotide-binding universal stress UspA family protein
MPSIAPQAALSIRNVLIATDFSPSSERALLHAVAGARHFGSTLHVLHVVEATSAWYSAPDGFVGAPDAAIKIARRDAERLVTETLRSTHCEEMKFKIYVEVGSTAETLRAVISREKIDMVVVGTHGRTGISRLVMGSVSEKIFRNAACPVLTVGPHSCGSDPQTMQLNRILFPTDLTAESARALPLVKKLASDFGATLTIMHVVDRLQGEAAHDKRRVVAALEQIMRDMAFAHNVVQPEMEFTVKFGDVATSVIDTAASLGADLVAFGLKAPDTYADRLPWMHAYKIVCNVGCPVLSLRSASIGA